MNGCVRGWGVQIYNSAYVCGGGGGVYLWCVCGVFVLVVGCMWWCICGGGVYVVWWLSLEGCLLFT